MQATQVGLLLTWVALSAGARQLLHSKQPDLPPCSFHPIVERYNGEAAPACVANDAYSVALTRAQQHTPATRVYTGWRKSVLACAAHRNQSSCAADTVNFCEFNAANATCSASPNLMQYTFSCSSTFAEAYYYCRMMGDIYGAEGCPSGPACWWEDSFITATDANACYPYNLLAENPTPDLLDAWKASNLLDFLNPDASMQLYGNCPESMAFQQASAYEQTCRLTSDAATCNALGCQVSLNSTADAAAVTAKLEDGPDGQAVNVTAINCAPRQNVFYQMLVGGAPSGDVYKQWSLCPRLSKKPKSCRNFKILYNYLG